MPGKPRRVVAPHDDPITRELRSAIADFVARDGQTLYGLARTSGVDEAAVRRFVSRERSITLDSADRLASALGLAVVRKVRRPKAPSLPS